MATNIDGHLAVSPIGHDNDATGAADRPLLRSFPNPSGYGTNHPTFKYQEVSRIARTKQYLTADIDTQWADLILIVGFFISGLIDAGAYNAYQNFASMQVKHE